MWNNQGDGILMTPTGKGKVVIISSPSGGGKSSICRQLLERNPAWRFSVSYTTRSRRPDEVHGREYFFVSADEFRRLAKQDFFAEHCRVHLYEYGTPKKPLEDVRAEGGVVLLDIDVQGAEKIKAVFADAITIFILPPSIAALRSRLSTRGTETQEQLQVRFENATREMRLWRRFEYAVINDTLATAVREVESAIIAHHCRTDRLAPEQIENIIG
ncbi:MAG TPA: guanylate kinase [candidate division Zixibacteria bacterium]|nr:guanylate kinase [candidate division Zixibacteria bacterium]HPI32571.1 guanylate kinase [candidate division Zixibacteria bacterium]